MKIAVISDTHGVFRPQVRRLIGECEAVIHAGDVCSQKLLDEIRAAAGENVPFYAVRGNNDRLWAEKLPERLEFELDGIRFFLVHNKKDIPQELGGAQIVIYGHSHKYALEETDGRLWLNPGSCGKRRFHLPLTMAILNLEQGAWSVEKIDISTGTKPEEEESGMGILRENPVSVIEEIFKRMDKGQTVDTIGEKLGLERDFVAQICRIRVTHPGVTAEGIVDKMEVNKAVSPPQSR